MNSKNIMKYIVILTVLLIPIMYSFFYLKAYWDPYGNLSDIKIAMVNEDVGEFNENQGKQFVETMVENGTFNICEANEEEANKGLEDGTYYAIIKIPATFTKNLNSAKENNKAISTIIYSPNQKTNFLASQIISSAVKNIEINLQAKVAKTVTENLVENLNDVPENLNKIADGSQELENGTNKLVDGAKELADGTNELDSKYIEFDNGINSAYTGSLTLDDGVGRLVNGTGELIKGIDNLKDGTISLDGGITSVDDGANELLKGVTSLNQGATTLAEGTKNLTEGASTLSSGATELETYLGQLYAGIQNLKNGYVSVDDGITEITSTLDKMKKFINTFNEKLTELSKLKSSNDKAITNLNDKNNSIKLNYNKYFSSYFGNKDITKITNEEIAKIVEVFTLKYSESLGDEASSIGNAYGALLTIWRDTYIGNLNLITLIKGNQESVQIILNLLQNDDLKALVSKETSEKLDKLKNGSISIKDGLDNIEKSTLQIYDGAKNLSQGTDSLVLGINNINTGAKTLKYGTDNLQTGTINLSTGTSKLKAGSTELVSGANKLVNGRSSLTTGIRTLKGGTEILKNGLYELSSSSIKVKEGISSINNGTIQLFDGIGTLKIGTRRFNNEINSGLESTKQKINKLNGLSEFTENPIEIKEEDYGKISQYGIAFTPLFLSIGLWVGALMAYVVLYYDQEKRFKLLGKYSDKKFLQIALYFIIAILQGIITGVLLKIGLGFNVTNLLLYYFTCILVSIVFMGIMQFLIMNFGDIGKFLALVILVLQLAASGGTFPLETVAKCFQGLNPFLPMTYSIKLIKESVVSIDSGFAIKNIIILAIYGVISIGMTLIIQKIKNKNYKKVS